MNIMIGTEQSYSYNRISVISKTKNMTRQPFPQCAMAEHHRTEFQYKCHPHKQMWSQSLQSPRSYNQLHHPWTVSRWRHHHCCYHQHHRTSAVIAYISPRHSAQAETRCSSCRLHEHRFVPQASWLAVCTYIVWQQAFYWEPVCGLYEQAPIGHSAAAIPSHGDLQHQWTMTATRVLEDEHTNNENNQLVLSAAAARAKELLSRSCTTACTWWNAGCQVCQYQVYHHRKQQEADFQLVLHHLGLKS